MTFNFEEWAALYKTDPAQFEQKRLEALQSIVAACAPERQENLERLLKRIHMTALRAKNSDLHRAILAKKLMMESLQELNEVLNSFRDN